jgi:hypothetical protein
MKTKILQSSHEILVINFKSNLYELSKSLFGHLPPNILSKIKSDSSKQIFLTLAILFTFFSTNLLLIGVYEILANLNIFLAFVSFFLFNYLVGYFIVYLNYIFYACEVEINCNKLSDILLIKKRPILGNNENISLVLSELNELIRFEKHTSDENNLSFYFSNKSGELTEINVEFGLPEIVVEKLVDFLRISYRKCIVRTSDLIPDGVAFAMLHTFSSLAAQEAAIRKAIEKVKANPDSNKYYDLFNALRYCTLATNSCHWREGMDILRLYTKELIKNEKVEQGLILHHELQRL